MAFNLTLTLSTLHSDLTPSSDEFNVNRPFFYKIIFSKQEEEEKTYLYNVPLFMGSFNGSTVTIDI